MSDCIEWQKSVNAGGYGVIWTRRANYGQLAHRVAYCEAHGLRIEEISDQVVMHTCDNPPCVNPEHLVLGSVQDNNRDRCEKGRSHRPTGELNGRSRLSALDVAYIRRVYVPGKGSSTNLSRLAEKFDVSRQVIWEVVKRKTWGNVA